MSKLTAILAGCAAASMISFGAQFSALAFSPAPTAPQTGAPEVTRVADYCGPGFHAMPYGGCEPNPAPVVQAPPRYIEGPYFGLPYIEPPHIGLPFVEGKVGLPYVNPPVVGLPYVGAREVVWPRACPYGYTYFEHSGRCVPI
jgi:hypothetical protein